MPVGHYIFGLVALVISGVVLFLARRSAKHADLYGLYVEADSLTDLQAGIPSFYSGTVAASQTLKTPYTQRDCVYYSYQVEREVENRDSQGNVSNQWQSMGGNKSSVQFALQRGTEQVVINPEGVDEVQGAESQQSLLGSGMVQGLNLMGVNLNIGAMGQGGQERINEEFIPPGMQLTVGGQVFDEGGYKTFRHDTQYPMVFTTKTKDALVSKDKTMSYVGYGVSLLAAVGGIVLLAVAKF